MRRLSAALPLAALAQPAAAGPLFTLLSDGAALSFAVAALAMVASLAVATRLALRGPRR
jgi:hypothetical protein